MGAFINLSGKRFGKWIVLERGEKSQSKNTKWKCLCDCGTKKEVLADSLVSGKSKSCGCDKYLRFNNSPNWTGYEQLCGTYWCSIVKGAKRRDLKFDISKKYVWDIFVKQGGICVFTGKELTFSKRGKCWTNEQTASLDRIDSSKGYIEGNVQWVHKIVNYMKGRMKDADFISMCRTITNHNTNNKNDISPDVALTNILQQKQKEFYYRKMLDDLNLVDICG